MMISISRHLHLAPSLPSPSLNPSEGPQPTFTEFFLTKSVPAFETNSSRLHLHFNGPIPVST